jgi:hypothetical protein
MAVSELARGVGPGSEVRFGKALQIFDLLQQVRKLATTKFGIGSVSAVMPCPARKIRYLSSAYCSEKVLSEILIIGRSKADGRPDQVLLGPPYGIGNLTPTSRLNQAYDFKPLPRSIQRTHSS